MSSDWSAIQSFQHDQDVLRAINMLSIYLKLKLKGKDVSAREHATQQARQTLADLLDDLEIATSQNAHDELVLPIGVNPRLQQLAHDYLTAQQHHRFRSRLFTESISAIKPLLASTDRDEHGALIECLADLRILVEEHIQSDQNRILGGV